MIWQAWAAVAVVAGVFAVLATTRVAPYLVLVGGLTVLLAAGVLPPQAALAGFSNQGLITVAVLFVVAGGLRQTGVLGHLVVRVLGRPRSERAAQARLAAPVMAASALLNNTPLVAMLMPAVLEWSRRVGIPASRLLIPLSYAAILGGTCTLIGTSTNLVVSGLWAESGHRPMHLFTIAPVAVPAALAGLAFMLLAGRRLLPDRGAAAPHPAGAREYVVEMRVVGEPVAGRGVAATGLGDLPGVTLTALLRGGKPVRLAPSTLLRPGDRLRFAGRVGAVAELQRLPGLSPSGGRGRELKAPPASRVFAEAVVSRTGPLAGRTLAEARFTERYGAVARAVGRGGDRPEAPLDQVVLAPGDALFLEAGPDFVAQHQNSADFCLVGRLDGDGPATRRRAGVALAILAGMVLAAGTGLLTMLQAAFVAALLMLMTGACSEETARRSIDWPMLVAIGAAFGLGAALERTGAAGALAAALLAPAGDHPWPALAVVYGVTMVLTEMVTNNAAAVIVFPIAMATAQRLGVDPMPFAVAVMLAASASFSTPLGYQTNLMVYGAGGYRVADFLRIGIPMNLVLAAVTLALTPFLFPF